MFIMSRRQASSGKMTTGVRCKLVCVEGRSPSRQGSFMLVIGAKIKSTKIQ